MRLSFPGVGGTSFRGVAGRHADQNAGKRAATVLRKWFQRVALIVKMGFLIRFTHVGEMILSSQGSGERVIHVIRSGTCNGDPRYSRFLRVHANLSRPRCSAVLGGSSSVNLHSRVWGRRGASARNLLDLGFPWYRRAIGRPLPGRKGVVTKTGRRTSVHARHVPASSRRTGFSQTTAGLSWRSRTLKTRNGSPRSALLFFLGGAMGKSAQFQTQRV